MQEWGHGGGSAVDPLLYADRVTRGERQTAAIFGRFGERLEARSYEDLLGKLAAIDRPVPRRTEGRGQADRERYCIVAYLLHLAAAGLLEYPLTIAKGEAPDFVLTFSGGRTRGVEVTEVSPEEGLRSKPWSGDEPEREWARIVLDAIERKVNGYDYGTHHELELLLYDLTGLGALVKLEDGAPFLREAIRSWRRDAGPQQVFSRISVLRDSALLHDVSGRWQVLRRRCVSSAWPAPPVRRPPLLRPSADDLAALCRRHGIRRLSLFGSALRGEDARDSDLDLLVEFEPGVRTGYIGLAGIERELTALFGRSVDLRTPGELGPHLRERILREAETQYAAS